METIAPSLRCGDKYFTTTFATSFTPAWSPGDTLPWWLLGDTSMDFLLSRFPSRPKRVLISEDKLCLRWSPSLKEWLPHFWSTGTLFLSWNGEPEFCVLLTCFNGFNSPVFFEELSLVFLVFGCLFPFPELRLPSFSSHQNPWRCNQTNKRHYNSVKLLKMWVATSTMSVQCHCIIRFKLHDICITKNPTMSPSFNSVFAYVTSA